MKVSFLPAGDRNTASSRIRVYTLIEALQAQGVAALPQFDAGADVFVFQKKVTPELLELAARLKAAGKPVVYDIDDLPPAQDYWAPPPLLRAMLDLAGLVTTDTQGHINLLRRDFAIAAPIALVPDSIDYFPRHWEAPRAPASGPLRVLWFGSVSNIAMFARYAHVLRAIPEVQVVVAVNPAAIPALAQEYPFVEFHPWSLDGFPDILRACHLTLLMHDGSEVDRTKSNNKMICSINLGVPAIVSDTPEYAATARLCGAPQTVFRDPDDVARCVALLATPEQRAAYLQQAQPAVWDAFSPPAVARRFLAVLDAHCAGGRGAALPAIDFGTYFVNSYRSGPLRFGWVGDVPARQPEVQELLLPAMGQEHPLAVLAEASTPAQRAAFFHQIDVLLLTNGTQPELALNAMACGVFPVGVRAGALPQCIVDGQGGLLADANGAALHAALAWCAGHGDEVRRQGYRQAQALAARHPLHRKETP